MMSVLIARLEAGAVARFQDFFAGIGDQHHFAFQHIDEFVLADMPVALAGPDAWLQPQQIDAELGQARGIAQPAAFPRPARLVIGRRIKGADCEADRWDRCVWAWTLRSGGDAGA